MSDIKPIAWRRESDGDVSDLGAYVYASNEDELDGYGAWDPLYPQSALDAQAAEIERLRAALESAAMSLTVAAGSIADWGGYADEYFQEKHELRADIEATQEAAVSARAALTPQPKE